MRCPPALWCLCAADTFIQKTKKLFQDTRSQRNMAALTADLAEVHTIMSKNIAEVLGQGEKLDSEWHTAICTAGQAERTVHGGLPVPLGPSCASSIVQ